jgi:hypothetical protein
MPEQGKVANVDGAGGIISAGSPSPVRYANSAVQGILPHRFDTVCFVRNPHDVKTASSVRRGSCDAAALALRLETAFHSQLGGLRLADDGLQEVFRMSMDRAARIMRPLPSGAPVPKAVKSARLALAVAAMKLMAAETASVADSRITAKSLRDVLRGQRPQLPR